MALLLIAAALLGFGYFQYAGISSWGAPWWVHVHAVSQMGWLGFYAVQNALVVRGDLAQHRALGAFGAFYAAWLLSWAITVSYLAVSTGTDDGLFAPSALIALNWGTLATFTVLFTAALAKRKRSDWHKRLMLCAMAAMSLPSFGRILLMLDLSTTTNRTLAVLSFIVIGMLFDQRNRGGVHPAYAWGAAAVVAMGLTIGGLPMLPFFVAFADGIAG